MARQSVEEIKAESRGLYGKIVETLLSDESHFQEAEYQLLIFHGSYQQDNRVSRRERRKQKLDKEGLFDEKQKKALPSYPNSIGVITSSDASVLRDVITTLKRRNKLLKIIIYPNDLAKNLLM